MKITIVPAQITTVEDTIIGNLTLTQAVLLISTATASIAIYLAVPPHNAFSVYKAILIVGLPSIGGILSLRLQNRLLVSWLSLICKYQLRSKIFVLDKQDLFLRDRLPQEKKRNAPAFKLSFNLRKKVKENTQPQLDLVSLLATSQEPAVFTLSNSGKVRISHHV